MKHLLLMEAASFVLGEQQFLLSEAYDALKNSLFAYGWTISKDFPRERTYEGLQDPEELHGILSKNGFIMTTRTLSGDSLPPYTFYKSDRYTGIIIHAKIRGGKTYSIVVKSL